jgi:hypothetical protein
MSHKKPTPIYRPLLCEAWKVTWERKSLWVFGLFAAVISSGGVIDVAISGIKQATASGSLLEHLLERSFIGYVYVSQFLLQLQKINQNQFMFLATLIVLVMIGLVCAGVLSQAALIHGAGEQNKHPHLIRRHVLKHFWDVLFVDLITKALSILLIALTILPVFFYLTEASKFSSNLLFVHFLLFIPAIVILHILSMFALVSVVEENTHAIGAIERAMSLFKTHWLASLEYGFILFLLVFGSGLVLAALLSLLSFPYSLIYHLALSSGYISFFFTVNIMFAFLLGAILFIFGGIVVTFQYSAWRTFYKRAAHRVFGLKPFAKIWRALYTYSHHTMKQDSING